MVYVRQDDDQFSENGSDAESEKSIFIRIKSESIVEAEDPLTVNSPIVIANESIPSTAAIKSDQAFETGDELPIDVMQRDFVSVEKFDVFHLVVVYLFIYLRIFICRIGRLHGFER